MKRVLILLLSVLLVADVAAQQDPQFSQNIFNKLANNPGFAGSRGNIATSVLHRSQWMGFGYDGAAAIISGGASIFGEDAAICGDAVGDAVGGLVCFSSRFSLWEISINFDKY